MKFKNGHWLMRKGITPLYATEFYSAEIRGNTVQMIVPTSSVDHRSATMMPALNVSLSSPLSGVIRVTAVHHKGAPVLLPRFIAQEETPGFCLDQDASCLAFTTGNLTARISKSHRDWGIAFSSGNKPLTRSGSHSLACMTDETTGERYMTDALDLGVGECVYGFGERFGAFVKNGQSIEIWNEDGGTCSEQAYKNVPFYMTNHGYGVFIDSTADISVEAGSEHVEKVQFSVKGESLSYLVISGPTPKEILEKYTQLYGRPALPPAWSMGLWLSTSFTTSYDEKTVTQMLSGMAQRDIPVHVFHYDCFWMQGFKWCDFKWDHLAFPDPQGMIERLKARGLRICVWINPYIAQNSELFDEGMENGYLVTRFDGSIWQTDLWQAGMGLVDFTNLHAVEWYQGKLKTLLGMGVDCFKTDFGERIPVKDIVWYDGADPVRMHNYYTLLYNQAVFTLLERERGQGEAVVFARSATAGGQKMPVHWGGDCLATFPSMAETLRAGLSLAACGFGFWSHDIGGFEMTAPASVYKRWCAFGLLSSHSRLHGSDSYRVPWLFDEEACDVLRQFTKLKCRLMPYLYAMACAAHGQGTPVLRPMFMEFPDDPACDTLDRQYMLGESLLVAPVMDEGGKAAYYLPEGRWTHLLNGREAQGGRWMSETYDYFSLPLWVRENTLLALGATDDKPDYDYTAGLTLKVFPIQDGCRTRISIPTLQGTQAACAEYSRAGNKCRVSCSCAATVLLPGGRSIPCDAGGVDFPAL
jgi:alpha-D-xyloside xylohydrolase